MSVPGSSSQTLRLRRLARAAAKLHVQIAAATVYDKTEPAMVAAERAMGTVERRLAEALRILESR